MIKRTVDTFTKFPNFVLPEFRCAKDIDTLIESLPNEDSSQELQAQSLRRLEVENQEAAKRLEEVSGLNEFRNICLIFIVYIWIAGC